MQIIVFRHRRYMTLIEMIVVMTIIAFVAGLIGININKAMQEQRFRTEVAMVTDKLRLAQNLMLILNKDVSVKFKQVEGGISYNLNFECPLNKGWDKELLREPQLLTSVKRIEFEGTAKKEKYTKKEFELNFLSSGMVMSEGILTLSTKSKNSYQGKSYIPLYGYPHPIKAFSNKEALPSLTKTDDDAKNLTQHVMHDIILQFQSLKNTK